MNTVEPQYTFHEFAELFPLLSEDDLRALADDIQENGQRHPIWLLGDKILDGRNHHAACLMLGIQPRFEHYTGNDPFRFVLSQNLMRRHLTESQRAMIAATIATRRAGERTRPSKCANLHICVPTQKSAAESLNVSVRSVQKAKEVCERGTEELIEGVKQGEITVAAAVAQLPPKQTKGVFPPVTTQACTEALERIRKVCGRKVSDAMERGIILLSEREILFFAGLNDAEMAAIETLVVAQRWKPTKAHLFVTRAIHSRTKVEELIGRCLSADGMFEAVVGGFKFTVQWLRRDEVRAAERTARESNDGKS
jgi:hypothetical protein